MQQTSKKAPTSAQMRAAILIAALAIPAPALSAPPPGTDPTSALSKWVRTMRDPNGVGCCSLADCRPVVARLVDGHWEAFIDRESFGYSAPDAWVRVTEDVLQGTTSDGEPPDTRTWACWWGSHLACFVAGGGM